MTDPPSEVSAAPRPTSPPSDGAPGRGEADPAHASSAAPSPENSRVFPQRRRVGAMLLVPACLVLAGVWWLEHRALCSLEHTQTAQAAALAQMHNDVERIRQLRATPSRVAERLKPNEELLAEVDQALAAAGVPQELWQDSIPQTPQRLAPSPYTRHSTRLYFEGMTLQQFTALTYRLLEADPALSLSALHLTPDPATDKNPSEAPPTWRADLAVSYLTYSPAPESQTGMSQTPAP